MLYDFSVQRMNAYSESLFRKRQRAVAATTFVEAAEQVIAGKGYAGATMQDIASKAGCAVGTLYLHFKNKEDLFNALVTRHTHAIVARAAQDGAGKADPLEQLRRRNAALIAYFNEHREFFRIFYAAGVTGKADIAANLRGSALRTYYAGKALETDLVRKAQKAGLVRRDIPAGEMVEFIHGVMMATLARWSTAQTLPPPLEQARLIWGLIGSGLGAVGGKR
ncbi:MAG: TetR/AcrR family transcriptional regulator [Planctomycetota bacterium]